MPRDAAAAPHPTSPATAIADTLATIRSTLADRTANAHTRALRAKVDSFAAVLDRWAAIPPTAAQQAALLELVDELRVEIEADAPRSTTRPTELEHAQRAGAPSRRA